MRHLDSGRGGAPELARGPAGHGRDGVRQGARHPGEAGLHHQRSKPSGGEAVTGPDPRLPRVVAVGGSHDHEARRDVEHGPQAGRVRPTRDCGTRRGGEHAGGGATDHRTVPDQLRQPAGKSQRDGHRPVDVGGIRLGRSGRQGDEDQAVVVRDVRTVQPGAVPEQRRVRGGAQTGTEQRKRAGRPADDVGPRPQIRGNGGRRELAEPPEGRLEPRAQRVTSVLSVTR